MSALRAGQCINCGTSDVLVGPLHLEKGGPIFCLKCAIDWHVQRSRERKKREKLINGFGLFGGTSFAGSDELTLELLNDTIRLTHPDKHPPERAELAASVTAELLALKPFVKPKPKPCNASATAPPGTPGRYGSATIRTGEVKKPPRPAYPCETCCETVPYYYCDACRSQWDAKRREDREADNAKQREGRARRRRRRPPVICAGCGTGFKDRRKDARYCSAACRQRAHRERTACAG